MSWSTGRAVTGQTARAVADFLPAVAVVAGVAVLVFAVVPRWAPVVWVGYAVGVVITYLGEALNLGAGILALSPFHLVGNPPVTPVDPGHVVLLVGLMAACVVAGYVGFGRRAVPHG